MRNATKWLLVAMLGLGLSTTASAQSADTMATVTFQVDLSSAIDNCAFDPAKDVALVRGAFNDWSTADTLSRVGETGVYTGTVELRKGRSYEYKFFGSSSAADYEGGNNRSYTVTEDDEQTLPVATFNKTFTDQCSLSEAKYRFVFTVDMSVARLDPNQFNDDPENGGDDFVVVAGGCQPESFSGCLNGWSATADTLSQDFFNPNLYTASVEVDKFPIPATGDVPDLGFKFVIGQTPGTAPGGWESINNRIFDVTGNEPVGTDGYREVVLDTVFYNNIDDSDIFTEPVTVILEVDARPAYYYVADNGGLPSDTQTGGSSGSSVDGLALNGPAAGRATSNTTGIADWSGWGETLAQIPARNFNDSGQNGDAVAEDSIWTQIFTYPAGTAKTIIGKLGVNGFDNEGGFGANQHFPLGMIDSEGRLRVIFGAIRNEDGTYTDQRGPSVAGGDEQPVYDPYIAIPSDSLSATVVRSGGQAVAVEDLGLPADGFTLSPSAPNPFAGQTVFRYTLPNAEHVTVRVYDVTGRVVATLVDAFQAASTYEVTFDGSGLAAGMYFYQVQAAGRTQTGQMTLVR